MERTTQLADVLRSAPRNCWLALSEDETQIVAHGKTPDDAAVAARMAGVGDPILIWAPDTWAVQVS